MSLPTAIPFWAFCGLLLVVGVLRLAELAVSRRRLRARGARPVAEPCLFPLMALVHAGLVFGPILEVVVADRPFRPALAGTALLVLVVATALRVWTLQTIGGAWNVRVVLPDADAVVTHGPYAWIRHPNYLAVILEIAALPLLHDAWISSVALSAVNAAVLVGRIRLEEAELMTIPAWREAMAGRARLIPGVF